ncbi:MAG: hypothetical protein JO113_08565, partial [Candidatus Eremiobacteraeota bacterium]|nr:hypothetical protein [Candidatus Eremiobacteraeota bacterium]
MNRGIIQSLPLLALVALAACSGGGINRSLMPATGALPQSGDGDVPFLTVNPVRSLCSTPGTPEQMQCFAMVRTDVMPNLQVSQAQVRGDTESCPFSQGYCPVDLQQAYVTPSIHGGFLKTVVIVDAYGYKHAATDLDVFRKTMGLKACVKCLRIVNQEGNSSPLPPEPPPSDDWRGEQSLDLD